MNGAAVSEAPHFVQKPAPSGFEFPHFGQFIVDTVVLL
jgi:hypothetical protein